MENENFAAPGPTEPLMQQTGATQNANVRVAIVPPVAVINDDDSKKKFLPASETVGVQYVKATEGLQVEVKQPPKFIGLTQEELQRYADDPFWRRLRMALFIIFWLAWILMFVAAIVLVAVSPKCSPKPSRHWWQKQVCYQTYTRTFKDSNGDGIGDFAGTTEQLEKLQRRHVNSIWPVYVLESKNFTEYDVTNFTNVDSRFGTLDEFLSLVKRAHSLDMHVIIDFPLATTSTENELFVASSRKSGNEPQSTDYVWHSFQGSSTDSGERWVYKEGKFEHYFTYGKNKYPVLNWASDGVRRHMKDALYKWLEHGVDGFYLGNIHLIGLNPTPPTDTNFVPETQWDRVVEYIAELRTTVEEYKNQTNQPNKEILFFSSLPDAAASDFDLKRKLIDRERGLNYILGREFKNINSSCQAICVRDRLMASKEFHDGYNSSWPLWELGSPYEKRLISRLNDSTARAEMFQMLLFMLEGSVNAYYGDEIYIRNANESDLVEFSESDRALFASRTPMQWNNQKHAGFSNAETIPIPVNPDYKDNNFETAKSRDGAFKLFSRMAEWRKTDDTFLYGAMDVVASGDDVLFLKLGAYKTSSNYYAIFHFGNVTAKFNLQKMFNMTLAEGKEAKVAAMTSNLLARKAFGYREAVKITALELAPDEGLVLKDK